LRLRHWLSAFLFMFCIAVPGMALAEVQGTCAHPGASGVPRAGVLDLDKEQSTVDLEFADAKQSKALVLVFSVDVCKIGPKFAETIPIDYRFSDVRDRAFGPRDPHGALTTLVETIPVDPADIDAGVHEGDIVVGGNSVADPVTVHVTLALSESKWWALGLAAAAWLVALVAAYATASEVNRVRLLAAGAAGALAVWPILEAQYYGVVGWTGGAAKGALFFASLTAAITAAQVAMRLRRGKSGQAHKTGKSPRRPRRVVRARPSEITGPSDR
jgi:hypothetical protein